MATRVVGTDPSGRKILMTDFMLSFWNELCKRLGFTPTIVQGSWMAGAGATASAGYHDEGGCLDLRTWNLNTSQVNAVIRQWRALGGPAWLRDERHGMDPHIHGVVGGDLPMTTGARWQIEEYNAGRDGLATRGSDYHPRPDPLVLAYQVPKPVLEDDMPLSDSDIKKIADAVHTRKVPMGADNESLAAQVLWRQARNAALAAKVDVNQLAAAVVKSFPAGVVSEEVVVAGVKKAVLEMATGKDQ